MAHFGIEILPKMDGLSCSFYLLRLYFKWTVTIPPSPQQQQWKKKVIWNFSNALSSNSSRRRKALSFSSPIYFMSQSPFLYFEFDFREPVRKTRPCIEDFLNASRRCLKAEDQEGLNIALRMIDSAIEFMCHNSGDRIACKYIFSTQISR